MQNASVGAQEFSRPSRRGSLKRTLKASFFACVALVLLVAWNNRNEGYLTAESGVGYALGIAGVAAMLLLLSYSARKRVRLLHRLGSTGTWFRAHMLLGTLGPVLIVLHSNFQLGSTNSRVALFSMLLVAGSGFVGRYIYTKIHHGLDGQRATLSELRAMMQHSIDHFAVVFSFSPPLQRGLDSLSASVMRKPRSLPIEALRVLTIAVRTRWMHLVLVLRSMVLLRAEAKRAGWTREERRAHRAAARRVVAEYMNSVRRAAQFAFYERLFALWHLFHVPLFFMLLIAATVHVVAVHMY